MPRFYPHEWDDHDSQTFWQKPALLVESKEESPATK
jgi:hypothetical protein